jgi:hypothetical protein
MPKKLIKNRAVKSLCFVMEATGGYQKPLVSFLLTEDLKVAGKFTTKLRCR